MANYDPVEAFRGFLTKRDSQIARAIVYKYRSVVLKLKNENKVFRDELDAARLEITQLRDSLSLRVNVSTPDPPVISTSTPSLVVLPSSELPLVSSPSLIIGKRPPSPSTNLPSKKKRRKKKKLVDSSPPSVEPSTSAPSPVSLASLVSKYNPDDPHTPVPCCICDISVPKINHLDFFSGPVNTSIPVTAERFKDCVYLEFVSMPHLELLIAMFQEYGDSCSLISNFYFKSRHIAIMTFHHLIKNELISRFDRVNMFFGFPK